MSEYNNEFIEFPKDWEVKRLGEIAEQMYYGLSVSGVDTPTQYKLITTTSINKETFKLDEENVPFCNLITNEDRKSKELTKYLVKKGDILISRSGTTGITILIDKDYNNMLFGSYLIKIRLNSMIDPKFFWYFAQSPFYWKQISSRGATIKNINLEILRNLQVPIPPLEEQKKIAEILNTVDSIIIDTTNLIEKLKLLKEKTLNLLITGKIWHKEFKDTEIGKIPKNWEVKKLKDVIIKAKSGGTPRRNIPEYWNGNIPFAKAQDITKSDKYLCNTEEFITKKGLENSNAWIVPENSLLLTIYGSIGFVAINKIPVATNQAIVGIIPNKNIIDTEFLYYWYLYFKPYWSKFIKKGTQPNLTLEIVLNNLIPIPPLEEQKKIAEILSTIDNKIETETKYLDYMKKLKEKLLAALMTGKIRVNSISISDTK